MAVVINGTTGINSPAGTISGPVIIAQSNGSGVAAISLTQDESTIQGPSANTQIRMGGNLVLNAAGQTGMATNGVDRLVIDSSGRVRMPYQPAFSAGYDNGGGYTNFTGTMLYNIIQSNVGSHYNSTNGRFTAPVTGNYYFAWNCLCADGSLYIEMNFNKNSTEIVRTQQDGGTNQIGGQIIINMAAGDYATIVSIANGTSTAYLGGGGVTYNQFSGFLIG